MIASTGKKILIVDDDADNIELLNILLAEEGYEVVSAYNGVEALRKVTTAFFNVILLDIRMPGMDGMQVLEKLKEESSQSQVIILTAYASDKSIRKACKADVFDFVDKPVDNETLEIKLDYTIPDYRDFQNAHFMYSKGVEKCIQDGYKWFITKTDIKSHQKYLKRVGFVPDSKKGNLYRKKI